MNLLTIAGKPTDQQLAVAWAGILQEYSGLVKTDKSETISALYNKIIYTECTINLLDVCIAQLEYKYDETIANLVANLGYTLIRDLEDRKAYLNQLYVLKIETNTLTVMLNQYATEYKAMCPDDAAPVKRTEMDYEKELRVLARWYAQPINSETESVFNVCAILNAYLDYVKANKPKE